MKGKEVIETVIKEDKEKGIKGERVIEIGGKFTIRKVTSHAGVKGYMTADVIAGLISVDCKAIKKFIIDQKNTTYMTQTDIGW